MSEFIPAAAGYYLLRAEWVTESDGKKILDFSRDIIIAWRIDPDDGVVTPITYRDWEPNSSYESAGVLAPDGTIHDTECWSFDNEEKWKDYCRKTVKERS